MSVRIAWACTVAGLLLLAACQKSEPPKTTKSAESQPLGSPAPPARAPGTPATLPTGAEPIQLFDGKDLSGWTFDGRPKRNFWKVGTASVDPGNEKTLIVDPNGSQLINAGIVGANILTERKFKDFELELEFMVPPHGNSGVFLLGQYELQILHDPKSDPAHPTDMDIAGVARLVAPKVLAPIIPGHWHTYEIDFRAPRFDATGKKTENARLYRVSIDGVVVHQNVEIPGPTPGALIDDREVPEGPILLQGSEGPAAFRNIILTPKS